MNTRFIALTCSALALSACQSTQDSATKSGFASPTASGFIGRGIEDFQKIAVTRNDSDGDGFAYAAGTLDGDGFGAYTGILPTTRVGAKPDTGAATMDGFYSVGVINNINLNGSFLSGNSGAFRGDITLRANFDTNRLTGTSDDGDLKVNGDLSGRNTLTGTVVYDGLRGNLQGNVSGSEAVGVFHGNNEDQIFAGGFLVDAR